ncbi:MAG: RluA family pseudouridine synthase [Deltaproteobacteria bacterium]|nr:MAG: RluA family pseudouridine synthase [Deltaproteobacteria bacterium]
MPWEIIVPQTEEPKGLGNFLKKRFHIGYVRKLFRKNGVRLNGKTPRPEAVARPGDRIQLYIPFEKRADGQRQKLSAKSLEILFQDDDLIIINKPAGIAVHEGKEILKRDSILGMLEATYRPQGTVPKLVHRVDKDTSGLLVVAKKDEVAAQLGTLFEEGGVDKEYLALVAGHLYPNKGTIDFPLPGRDGQPVPALTHYKVEKEFSGTSLVRVRIETGRMHQIRLHFARIGHPVVMDDQHGDFAFNKQFRKAYGLKRQFLHAAMLAFDYHGKKRKWSAPLPEDLARTVRSLEAR